MRQYIQRFLKPSPGTIYGVDFGSSSVKFLAIEHYQSGFRVLDSFSFILPPETVVDKAIQKREVFVELLKEAADKIPGKNKSVLLAVPDSSVISKVVQFDKNLSDYDIEQQIPLEADKHIPYPLDEVSLDFSVLGPSARHEDLMDVLLVACRREVVTSRVSAFEEAGFQVQLVDVESYAILRACELLNVPQAHEDPPIIAVFDIGAHITHLTVIRQGHVIFTREELFGGDKLLRDIQDEYQYTPEEARMRLDTDNLPDNYRSKILEPFKESIALQIRRALQFFFSNSQYSEIQQVFLAGGGASLSGICSLVADQLGVNVSVANPIQSMSVANFEGKSDVYRHGPSLMVCCGLALRHTN